MAKTGGNSATNATTTTNTEKHQVQLSEREAFMARVEAVSRLRGLGRSLRPTGLERRVMRGSTQTA